MTRCEWRMVFTILMYVGAALFSVPYFRGEVSRGVPLLIGGVLLTVTCGLLRCYLMDAPPAETNMNHPHV